MFDADLSGCLAEVQISGDHRTVAYLRDEIRSVQLAVAVDPQAQGVAKYRWGIENFRERRGDARRADTPRNVPYELSRRQTEVIEVRRDVIAGVIAEEDKAAGPLRAEGSRRLHGIVIRLFRRRSR